MIQIDDKVISGRVLEEKFICDLKACKGACCIEGDAGAPLEKDETETLDKIFKKVKPYMRKEGIEAVEQQGAWIKSKNGELETPLVNGAECAYVVFDKKGTALCSIEQAYLDKKIKFKKPISCHLYPIRVSKNKIGEVLNYDEWSICKAACALGKKEDVKVYEFLREPIERKWGKKFYKQLEEADKLIQKKRER
ncbi:MAG: DUF3109 family protein [Flavobacteriales bacterium]